MDFARTPPPERRPHDFRGVLSEAVTAARARAEAKPVALRAEMPDESLPASVDRDQMLSLLTNLLFNAIDAAPPGGEVSARLSVARNGTLVVEVTDTGSGIDPAIADRLFTPFTTTKLTGTGLGLTVARRVANDHGGSLTACNRPEGGACFTLILPPEGSNVQVASSG
jgi:signal transduction histidine kinase